MWLLWLQWHLLQRSLLPLDLHPHQIKVVRQRALQIPRLLLEILVARLPLVHLPEARGCPARGRAMELADLADLADQVVPVVVPAAPARAPAVDGADSNSSA
jgi:hypothetical protein